MSKPPLPHAPPCRFTAMVRRLILVWLVVISFDTGCSARCAGHSAERASRKRQIKRHIFKKPPEQVFDAVRAVFADKGYELKRPGVINDSVYTSRWKSGVGEERALTVRIDKRLTGGVKIKIHELVERDQDQGHDRRRLYDDELAVIKRLEPVKARAIQLMARAHRRTAEDGARGCGCAETCVLTGCEDCHGCQNCNLTPRTAAANERGGAP